MVMNSGGGVDMYMTEYMFVEMYECNLFYR